MKLAKFINNNGELRQIHSTNNDCEKYRERLFCLNCGEKLDLANGKINVKHFKHHHGSFREDCENYSNAVSENITQSEVYNGGGSLYIIHELGEYFLAICLPGVSEDAINSAELLDITLELEVARNKTIICKIDRFNFAPYIPEYIKVDDVIINYSLQFSNNRIPEEIVRKWNDKIDGIGDNGALFEYNESAGKKVKTKIGLYIGEKYFLLTNRRFSHNKIKGMNFEEVQELDFGWLKTYRLYKVEIYESNLETIDFCSQYDLKINEARIKVVPVWPPCSINEDELYYKENGSKFLAINGSIDISKHLYSHSTQNKIWSQSFVTNKTFTVVNMEDHDGIAVKNTEYVLLQSMGKRNFLNYERNIVIDFEINESCVSIKSCTKVFVNCYINGMICNSSIIKDDDYQRIDSRLYDQIEVLHGLDLIWEYRKPEKNKAIIQNVEDDDLLERITKCKGELIPVPSSFRWMTLKKKSCKKSFIELERIIIKNQLTVELYNLLKK